MGIMTPSNTPAFAQRRWSYQAQPATANTTYTTTPTNIILLASAGPDGSVITKMGAIPNVTVTTANQLQIFKSPDFSTTNFFVNSAVMATYTMAQNTAAPVTNILQLDGLTIGETNGYPLKAMPLSIFGISFSQQSPGSNYYSGGFGSGTANAQTLPTLWQNGVPVQPSSFLPGSIIDYMPSVSNSGAATLKAGTQSGTPAVKVAGQQTALVGGELALYYPSRVWWDGTVWNLMPVERIYVAIGQSQKVTFDCQGIDF